HKASRPAEVDIRLSRNTDSVQNRSRQVTGSVEVFTYLVKRARPAIANIAAATRKREYQAADLHGEWMMLPIASRVQPQDLLCGARGGQRVQHRQNRRRPDPRAEQHHRPISGLQNETSARRSDIESVAHTDVLAQVGSSRPARLDLYADS